MPIILKLMLHSFPLLQQSRKKMSHTMLQVEGRRRCVLCCRLCFTADKEPKVKDRCKFHAHVNAKGGLVPKGSGRFGHFANHTCSVCRVPLCTKKYRFPGVEQTCWQLWHTEQDLENGQCATYCHIQNPGLELGIPTTKTQAKIGPIITASTNEKGKKRKVVSIGYGLKPQRISKRTR